MGVNGILGPRVAWATAVAVAVALAATLACAPAMARGRAASIQPFFEYTVAFNGHGSYTRTSTGEGGQVLKEEASWSWSTVYPHVLIPTTSASPLSALSVPAYGLGQEGSGKWTITNMGSVGEDCSNSGTLGLPPAAGGGGGGGVKVHRPGVGLSRGVIFNLTALTAYKTTSGAGDNVLPCNPSDFWQQVILGFASPGVKHTVSSLPDVQPLSTTVKLAPSDLRHARVSKNVAIGPAEMIASNCGEGGGTTCQQSYTWSGNVRFTKHKL
jgi:hypothetical protein